MKQEITKITCDKCGKEISEKEKMLNIPSVHIDLCEECAEPFFELLDEVVEEITS